MASSAGTGSLQLTKRLWAWLVSMDVYAQDKWFGGKRTTISAHLGYMQKRFGGSIPWRVRPLQAALSRVLDWIDEGHCQKMYEKEISAFERD
jgi:hypothetical protein